MDNEIFKKFRKPILRIHSKRGQAQYLLESAFRIGFLIAAMFIFFLMISLYINNQIDTKTLTYNVFVYKIMYSDAIMYSENGRTYTGIVDIDKFNSDSLLQKIDYSNKRYVAAKLTIISNKDGTQAEQTYLNKAQYEVLKPLAQYNGKGGSTAYMKQYPITYKNQQQYSYGTLIIEVLVPNS